MVKPEISHYTIGATDDMPASTGRLFQYAGGVFLKHEVAEEEGVYDEHVSFSTQFDPAYVRRSYEVLFGVPAVVEDDPELVDAVLREYDAYEDIDVACLGLGADIAPVVENDSFFLTWMSRAPVSLDRPDEVAQVMMSQFDSRFDHQHITLIGQLADLYVVRDLPTIFQIT